MQGQLMYSFVFCFFISLYCFLFVPKGIKVKNVIKSLVRTFILFFDTFDQLTVKITT